MIDFDYLREEFAKCLSDPSRVYMIQNYLKTRDTTQGKDVPFKLFPRQQDLCQLLGSANNVVTTKPRQAGITTTCGAFLACEMCMADPEAPITVLVIGNTLDLAQLMLNKIVEFLLQFPRWMWGDEYIKDLVDFDKAPKKEEIFKICNQKQIELRNGCKAYARSSGPDASRGVGGVNWLIFDEAAFIENGKDVYASAVPTVSTGGHIVMISTPNGKDLLYYETCRRAKLKGTDGWNNFELLELKWYQDPRYNKFLEWYKKNDKGEIEIFTEPTIDSEGNIRFDQKHWDDMLSQGWAPRSPWYLKMCQQFNNDELKIAQELDVSFLGSARNVVAPETIEMQQKLNVKTPIDKLSDGDMFHLDETWIWKPPIPGHRYLLACDASRGDADDRTAIEIVDIDAIDDDGKPCYEQVLEYNGKKTGDDIGEIIYWYGKWYGNAYVVVDCIGGTGDAIVLTLMRLKYQNLFYDDPNLKTYTIQRDASSLQLTNDGKLPGFHSSSVRFQMLTFFANLVKTNQFKVRSSRVISELDTWIYKGVAGRIDHQDGCHDDTLTCLSMLFFVMQFHLGNLEKAKQKDAAFLNAWINSAKAIRENQKQQQGNIRSTIDLNEPYLPIYTNNTINQTSGDSLFDAYGWLLS